MYDDACPECLSEDIKELANLEQENEELHQQVSDLKAENERLKKEVEDLRKEWQAEHRLYIEALNHNE
jgi:predicted RNase H-like nuclease (RuvC/YqgF family)